MSLGRKKQENIEGVIRLAWWQRKKGTGRKSHGFESPTNKNLTTTLVTLAVKKKKILKMHTE